MAAKRVGLMPGSEDMTDEPWRLRGACVGVDPWVFRPSPALGCQGEARNEAVLRAKAYCNGCEVREECLEAAGPRAPGIWGGKTERERRSYFRTKRRAEREEAAA